MGDMIVDIIFILFLGIIAWFLVATDDPFEGSDTKLVCVIDGTTKIVSKDHVIKRQLVSIEEIGLFMFDDNTTRDCWLIETRTEK